MISIMEQALDDTEKKSVHGVNRYSRITPVSGLTNGAVILDAAVTTDVTWEIPATVCNLSKSYLSFAVNVPAQAGGQIPNVTLGGCSPIARITLMTRTGVNLVDIPNFQNFMLTTGLVTKTLTEYMTADIPTDMLAAPPVFPVYTTGIAPIGLNDFSPDPVMTGVDGSPLRVGFNIPLSHISHSLFALNRSLYFAGEILNLRVSFSATPRIGYRVATAGAAVTAFNALPTIVATPVLQLAVESSPEARALIMNKCLKGYSFKTGYTYVFRSSNTGGAATFTSNLRLNRGHGSKLLRVYTTNMNQAEANGTSHTCISTTDFRSMIDQNWLQDYTLTTASNDDWLYMKPLFAGSALVNLTQRNTLTTGQQFMLDQFCSAKPHEREDDTDDGLDLNQEKQYTVAITAAGNSALYQFVVCQRTISIAAGLIQIV